MRTTLAILTILFASASHGVSFNCSIAQSRTEHLICSTPELSELDNRLAQVYKYAAQEIEHRGNIRRQQIQWLAQRESCSDILCIKTSYIERIQELSKIIRPIDNPKTCGGDVKRSLDLAALADDRVTEKDRESRSGRLNDGTLNFGGSYLRADISLMYAKIQCWQAAQAIIGKIAPSKDQEGPKANLSIELAKEGHWGAAMAVLDSLKSEEAFSESTYGIAEELVKAGHIKEAKEVLKRVTSRDNFLESPSFWLIHSLINAGHLSDAGKMLDDSDPSPNEWLSLASAYMKKGMPELAEKYIQKAFAIVGAPITKVITTSNEPSEDDELYSRETAMADHVYGWVTTIYIEGKKYDLAYKSASAISSPLDKMQILLRLAEAQHQAGNMDRSTLLYAEATKIMTNLKGDPSANGTDSACAYIAQSYAKSGLADKVIDTVSSYCSGPVQSAVPYRYAVIELAKIGDIDGALRVQAKADPLFKNDFDAPIAAALARGGKYALAAEKARGIQNPFIRADDAVRRMAAVTPPSEIVLAWLEDTRTIQANDCRAAAVQTLTAALARSNSFATAMSWLDHEPQDLVLARGYLGIAQGMIGITPGKGSPDD